MLSSQKFRHNKNRFIFISLNISSLCGGPQVMGNIFSLSLSSLCVIYPRGRSVHSYKNYKTYVVLSKNSLWHTLMKFKNRLIFPIKGEGWGEGGIMVPCSQYTHKKYTPEYLTWWKYFINGSTLHSLFWNHWWDTWLVGFLIRVIMLQTLIHKSVWILFKIIDKVPCSQYTHKNTHLNIWLDGSISLLVLRCILCSEIIGGILG